MGRNAPTLISTVVKVPPTDSQLQHYDYDIIMSSGGNRSPMLDFAQGVVAPQNGHSKCPRDSRHKQLKIVICLLKMTFPPDDLHIEVHLYCFGIEYTPFTTKPEEEDALR